MKVKKKIQMPILKARKNRLLKRRNNMREEIRLDKKSYYEEKLEKVKIEKENVQIQREKVKEIRRRNDIPEKNSK